MGLVDIWQLMVGCQAVIAGKPAPTMSAHIHRTAYTHQVECQLAVLLILIWPLIHPPRREAEWRCSSGDWRAAPHDAVGLIACRCSEANRRAMPPDECRSEGTPSLSEGPYVWARPFGYFGLGRHSGVCQKCLAVRAKPQAAVTAEMDMYTCKISSASHIAFASKPAPTGFGDIRNSCVHPNRSSVSSPRF